MLQTDQTAIKNIHIFVPFTPNNLLAQLPANFSARSFACCLGRRIVSLNQEYLSLTFIFLWQVLVLFFSSLPVRFFSKSKGQLVFRFLLGFVPFEF